VGNHHLKHRAFQTNLTSDHYGCTEIENRGFLALFNLLSGCFDVKNPSFCLLKNLMLERAAKELSAVAFPTGTVFAIKEVILACEE